MRKTLVQLLIMTICMFGAILALAQTDPQQADRNKQDQTECKETKTHSKEKQHDSKNDDGSSKQAKPSQTTEGDPDAPQNRVEYGGGG
jgi:Ni/Co efflux regulator RcnB